MKKYLLPAVLLTALAACTGNQTSNEVSDSFLGEVGQAMYDMYDTHMQWEAYMQGEGGKAETRDAYGTAIQHFLETKDNAIGKTVNTETAEGAPFKVTTPFTVKKIGIRYENEPIQNSQTEVRVNLEAELELPEGEQGDVSSVYLVDANDSVFYECQSFTTIEGNQIKVHATIEDYYGTKFNKEGETRRSYYSYILKTKKIIIYGTSASNKDIVQGELGIFDLRGPVKQCTVVQEWGNTVRTFDEKGFWLTNNGEKLANIYPSGMERDAQGRIVKGLMDSDGNGEDYTYDSEGRVTKYFYHYYDDVNTETTTWNPDGTVKKRHFEPGGMDMIEPYDETYENIETDEHGNWTKRKVSSTDGTTRTETRKILYY